MRLNLNDQQAMGFLIQQTSHIEAEVNRIQYPDITYPTLVPVDTSANEWAKSITYFSMDRVGQANWFDGNASNMPVADISRAKHEATIEMAAIGYRYTLEELGFAMLVPGTNLTSERADAARRAYEEFMQRLAFVGDTRKGVTGLFNNANVSRTDAANDGTGSSRLWKDKTADLIIRDVNDVLLGVFNESLTVEIADTVLLPIEAIKILAEKRIDNTSDNVLSYLMKNNFYTFQTGRPLTIRGVLDLDSAGSGGVGRLVAYRRDPQVVKFHVPMPHRFLPVWQTGPMTFDIPGIFRVGSVDVRRPGAMRYLDGITPVPA